MHRDVFSAALRATAKVAFSMALVAGCTASESPESSGASDSDIKKGCSDDAKKSDAAAATSDAANATKPDAAAPDCAATLASYEADRNEYLTKLDAHYADGGENADAPKAPPVSAEAKACCHDEVSKQGFDAPHRDSCCQAALSWFDAMENGDKAVQSACTPWGPPVPPTMHRRTAEVLA